MRTLVTGGAGFIGSHLVDALIARGDAVTVLDDLSKGRRERLDPATDLIVGDVRDPVAVSAAFERARPETCFHLAAQADVRVSVSEPGLDGAINVLGTINVLEGARAHSARTVFASTGGAIYGESPSAIPTSEEERPYPEAPYGTAKLCAEEYVALYARLHGAANVTLRLANVYGPRQDPWGEAGVVSIFAGRLHRGEPLTVFGDGAQTRDYVHVHDVVQAFLRAASHPQAGLWNVGSGVETTVLELAEVASGVTGAAGEIAHAPARMGELPRSALDAGRAQRDLGWQPERSLVEGVRSVCEWVAAGEPPR